MARVGEGNFWGCKDSPLVQVPATRPTHTSNRLLRGHSGILLLLQVPDAFLDPGIAGTGTAMLASTGEKAVERAEVLYRER